jgi:hypothetical protein
MTPQLDRSRALNSEGLEGLIPRATLLLQTGGTFFLGFLPLILVASALFVGMYMVRPPSRPDFHEPAGLGVGHSHRLYVCHPVQGSVAKLNS